MANNLHDLELKQVGEARAEAERRVDELLAILSSMADPLLILNTDRVLQQVNRAAADALGFAPHVGTAHHDAQRALRRLRPRRDSQHAGWEAELPWERALRGETVTGERMVFSDNTGDERSVAVSAAPLMHHGNIAGAVLSWRDTTAHVEAAREREQLLAEVQRQADELRQVRDELVLGAARLEARVEERTAALTTANQALEQSRSQLRALSRRLVKAQEAERRTVTRELHDDVGQLLTSLMVGLGILERRYVASPEAIEHIAYLKQIAEETVSGIHRLGADLRPAILDKLGLVPALRQYASAFAQRSGLRVDFETADLGGVRLPPEVEVILYRLVLDAMENVAQHARASRLSLMLMKNEGLVTAIIEDDGIGFDPELAAADGHVGILAMRERAEMLGGRAEIESAPGKGTALIVQIPYLPLTPRDSALDAPKC